MTTMNKLDHLTGLHTRDIMDELDNRFSNTTDETWSITMIDIDHFKLVNDVFGHLEGDTVIRRVANILSRNKRNADTLIRYGGDEFVIIMPETEQIKAVNQGERILQALEREVFPEGMEIGLSIGVAESKPEDNHLADILERADKALYRAKKGGRGRVSFYEDHKKEEAEKNITFEHFVGRSEELTELRNTLNDTVTGRGNFVVISGAPGIGKTRLANELEHYSSFKNCIIMNTRCDELGTDRPYLLITDPLTDYLNTLPEDDLVDLRNTLPDLLPQTIELFQNLNLRTAPAPETDKDSVLRIRMYSEISQIIKWIASRQPVIFTVDNLHWISEHDFDLLAYLSRAAIDAPILFLATMRAPTENFPEIQKKLKDLSGVVRYKAIRLKALNEEYTKHMVLFALRDPKIPKDILKRLVRQCSGNPLYLKELLLSLRSSGAIEPSAKGGWAYQIPDDMSLPTSISVLMEERLKGLTSQEKEVLCVGSMMPGGSFSIKPLAVVLGKGEFQVAKILEEPLRRGLVIESITESNQLKYQFIHDTMRTFLYQQLSMGIRKSLQSLFGKHYETIYNNGDDTAISLAAHHYSDSLDSEKARIFALKAAAHARSRGAIREHFRWLKQYMLFADLSKEDRDEAYKARFDLGSLYSLFGKFDESLGMLKAAAELADNDIQVVSVVFQEAQLHSKRGDYSKAFDLYKSVIKLIPSGKYRIQALTQMAHFHDLISTTGESIDMLESVLPEIQAITEENLKKQLLADYYMTLGLIAQQRRPQPENTEACLKAVALYRELSDRGGEAKALLNTAVSLRATGKYEQRINILNDGLKVLIEIGDSHATLVAYINLGETFYSAMQYNLARDYFHRSLKLVETTGYKAATVWANYYLGLLDKEDKNFAKAKEHLTTAIDMADELGLNNMALTTRTHYAGVLVKNGEYTQADTALTELEANKQMEEVDSSTKRLMLFLRGIERLENPHINRTTALQEAETNLKAAMALLGEEPTIQDIEILTAYTDCLHRSNRHKESQDVFKKAETLLNNNINAAENDHYKEAILNSPIIEIFEDLRKLLQSKPGQ